MQARYFSKQAGVLEIRVCLDTCESLYNDCRDDLAYLMDDDTWVATPGISTGESDRGSRGVVRGKFAA